MQPILHGALVGFGFIAEQGHLPAYRTGVAGLEITSVADPCAGRRAAAARALPGVRIYADHRELLEREKPDFVDVCGPPTVHAGVVLDAVAGGAHVLCEKPLAAGAAEAEAMIEAARKARRVLYPGHSYRHAPVVREVRSLLAEDVIGPVKLVTLDTYRTGHARGAAEWSPDWRRDRRHSGGGILMDHGPHTAYLAFEWMGGHPTSVSAWTRAPAADAVEEDAVCTLTFPTGLARAHMTWTAGVRRVLYTLHGPRGAIVVQDDDVEVVTTRADGTRQAERCSRPSDWRNAGHGPWFEGVLLGFEQAILEHDYAGREARDALGAMQVIEAAMTSARRHGAPVPFGGASDAALGWCA
jgi:predicted dehydrogenase